MIKYRHSEMIRHEKSLKGGGEALKSDRKAIQVNGEA